MQAMIHSEDSQAHKGEHTNTIIIIIMKNIIVQI